MLQPSAARAVVLAIVSTLFMISSNSLRAADTQNARKHTNVLWIVADDMAAHAVGAYGDALARTPNIDRLAGEGIRFDRAYCNSPMCTASRASFITGRLPHAVGVTQLRTPLGDEPVTIAELFKSSGYATATFGKMHFNRKTEPGLHGFDVIFDRPDADRIVRARGALPIAPGLPVQPQWRPFRDPARVWLNAACLPQDIRQEDMDATIYARQAGEFVEQHRDRPFFLMVSFYQPHSPFYFPPEYSGLFDPSDFTPPEIGPEDDAQIPEIFRELTREEIQGINAAYHTSAAFMDHCVGMVLDALESNNLAANTLVVFIGDHGYSLGHHGRIEKHCFYEPSVRAPLIMRGPGVTDPGRATDALVEFIDIYPTLARACGLTVPEVVEGRALNPILSGDGREHRDFAFSEYTENEEAMIRDGRWKLIYTTGARERKDGYATGRPLPGRTVTLFDTVTDPDEFRNVASAPENEDRVNKMLGLMRDRLIAVDPDRDSVRDLGSAEKQLDRLLVPPEERAPESGK